MMDGYRILHQIDPAPWTIPHFCQSGFLFHEYAQLSLQPARPIHLVSALNVTSGQTEARCAFFLQSNKAVSPAVAPFGSIECTETLPDWVLDDLVSSLLKAVKSAGASQLQLTHYPTCYAPTQTARLTTKLTGQGFRLVANHPTYFLPITDNPLSHSLAPAERRRLRKCEREGFRATHEPQPNLATIMTFLQKIRQQKGYPFPIIPQKLTYLFNSFPNHYAVFTVRDDHKLIALSLTVRVRHDILYSFLPASHPDYDTFSPMVMLTDALYQYGQHQQISLLDLGASLDHHHQPKPSLARFKRNLGAQESPKLVFCKTL